LVVLSCCISCSTSKRLAEGEVLYTGAEVAFTHPDEIDQLGEVTYQLEEMIKPEPNGALLGLRPKLWIYQKFGRKKPDGIGGKIKQKFGAEPVLVDTARARRNTLLMRKYLQDQGYFHSEVSFQVKAAKQKAEAEIVYQVETKGRYTFGEVIYPRGPDTARQLIGYGQLKSVIQTGDPYRLVALQAERQRLSVTMREAGFAGFFPTFLYYTLDTLSHTREVRVRLWVKDPTDSTVHRPFFLKQVLIYPDYTLDSESQPEGDSLYVRNGLSFSQPYSVVKPKVLRENILLSPGNKYSQKAHAYTLSHLQDLGTYKFVNIKYRPDLPGSDSDSLVAQVYLTPKRMQEIGVDLEGDTRTGLFSGYGTNLSLTYSHQNLFHGGERFNANLNGSAVFQPGDTSSIINTVDLSARVDLFIPRFVTPFRINHVSRRFLPQTRISLNYSYQQRIGFYTLGSLGGSFGYQWKESTSKQHELTPLSLLAIDLLRSSDDFDSLLRANPFLRSSFSNVLILGPQYSYTYQESPKGIGQVYHYFRGGLGFSGNLLWLGYRALRGQQDNAYQMFGRPFAQFSRLEVDYRSYVRLAREQTLIARLSGGVGVPYGNSEVLPYLKQFFIGGPVSLRAFGLRTIGPGAFQASEGQSEIAFVDQTGDMLIEANVEYRFPLISYLKGALFADAGNVWLIPGTGGADPTPTEALRREQGVFAADRFLGQTAVGAGFGLRLDVDFFVLRFDIATPLRRPDRPAGQRWVFDQMQPFYLPWLRDRDNLRLVLAIGYPF
jgi:outer membrane protein assembly factor BamA